MGCVAFGLVLATSVGAAERIDHQSEGEEKARVFRFVYGATLNRIPDGAHVRVWLPVPQTNDHQEVETFEASLPTQAQMAIEPRYGNKILYFERNGSSAGSLCFETSSLVRRREVRGLGAAGNGKAQLTEKQRRLFLAANEKVPLSGRPLQLLADATLPSDQLAMARVRYGEHRRVSLLGFFPLRRPWLGTGRHLRGG